MLMTEPKPKPPPLLHDERREYYAGIRPEEYPIIARLLTILHGQELEAFVEDLEMVVCSENGEVAVIIKQRCPVYTRKQVTRSLRTK